MSASSKHNRILLGSIALEPNRWTATKEPANSLTDLLRAVSTSGFRHMEVWEFHINQLDLDEIANLRQLADDLDISFPALALYPDFLADEIDNQEYFADILDRCSTLGIERIKMFAGNKSASDLSPAERDLSLLQMTSLVDEAALRNIAVSAELHQDTLCDTVEDAIITLNDMNGKMSICFQPLDFTSTEKTLADYNQLNKYVEHIHLQGRKDGEFSLLSDADIDYEQWLAALAANDYRGDYCIEFVRGCVVPTPDDFNLDAALITAKKDRDFLSEVLRQTVS